MSGFSFRDLTLAGVETQRTGGNGLPSGQYICEVTNAELADTRNGGKQVVVTLRDQDGHGEVKDFINVQIHTSEEATRIGRERLKALLVYGGHPTPDQPGDIKSLKGLRVGVIVDPDVYTNKSGQQVAGAKPRRSGCYFSPSETERQLGPDGRRAQVAGGRGGAPYEKADAGLNDDVPFD